MKCNIGCTERGIRIAVGAVLLTLAFTQQVGAWAWVGVVPLATGLFKFCPLYSLIKRNGCCNEEGVCCNSGAGPCK
jgi:hypothetical protein